MYSFYETTRSKEYGRTSTNMYLQYKWDMENFANHRFNVKTAKPRIDNAAPLTFTHMFIRPKKLQQELERYSTIQRNNRHLLERLATVQREGAWIDNKNYHEIKSLNIWKRQQEMIYLAYNNQIMLGRLLDVHAGLNKNRLEDEYLMNLKYKANIRKYPPNWREIQEHMNRLKVHTFKKVFDLKYQTKAYRKERKKEMERWAREKKIHAAAKAEKAAAEAMEIEKKQELEKEKRKRAAEVRKKIKEERVRFSEKRQAREERIKLAHERRVEEEEKAKKLKEIREKEEAKIRYKKKEELNKWKMEQSEKKKEEEEKMRKKQEEERQRANKIMKARMAERRKAAKDREMKKVQKDQVTVLKDKSAYGKDEAKKERKSKVSKPDFRSFEFTPGLIDGEQGEEEKDGEFSSSEGKSIELQEAEDHREIEDNIEDKLGTSDFAEKDQAEKEVPEAISEKYIGPSQIELESLKLDKDDSEGKSEKKFPTSMSEEENNDNLEHLENGEFVSTEKDSKRLEETEDNQQEVDSMKDKLKRPGLAKESKVEDDVPEDKSAESTKAESENLDEENTGNKSKESSGTNISEEEHENKNVEDSSDQETDASSIPEEAEDSNTDDD